MSWRLVVEVLGLVLCAVCTRCKKGKHSTEQTKPLTFFWQCHPAYVTIAPMASPALGFQTTLEEVSDPEWCTVLTDQAVTLTTIVTRVQSLASRAEIDKAHQLCTDFARPVFLP